uniref:Ecdysteroid kinase n=1 Tax=Musca domestica TaxID=7370 RepID=T1PCR4_MUSDO
MKVPHDSELYRSEMSKWQMFTIEALTYKEIVREFEQMYADVGLEIKLSPQSYQLPVDKEYILLEDLKKLGFRNTKRQDGLDMEHCKKVLKKLAQWHAASAVRIERQGPYPEQYVRGLTNRDGFDLLRTVMLTCAKNAAKSAKTIPGHELYLEKMEKLGEIFTENFFEKTAVDPNEFNVLNHGDCWSNNIMFQYDDQDQLRECYFVDLQIPRYGSVAQDVTYFLMTSAKLEVKVNRFDELIRYYHSNLKEHLQLLNYSKTIPSLGDIHRVLINNAGTWGAFAMWNVLPAVLAPPSKDANVENLISDSEESDKFKELIYLNDNIRKHYELVFPWLYHRGAFDLE